MSAAAEIARALGGKPDGAGWIARCPCHIDNTPSLSIGEGDDGKALLHCFAGCSQDELVGWARKNGHNLGGRRLTRRAPIPEKSGSQRWSPAEPRTQQRERLPARRILATFDYRDVDGNLSYQAVRWNPKTFKQRRPGPKDDRGNDTWIENIEGITPLPYRLPQLLAAPDETVFICEGEKDADRLAKEGLVATTNSGGAGKVEIWAQLAKANWLKDRRVVLIPDNDESGRANVPCVARALTGVAASIRVLTLPGLKEKGDVSDWLDVGGTIDEFCRLAHEAPLWDPAFDGGDGEDPDDKEIARLAALTRIKYGKERKEAAKELGVPVAILDASVAEKRAELFPKDDDGDGQGRRLEFVDNAPWDEEVEGAELLDGLEAGLAKYVILTPHQRHALALYTVFDYAFAAFEHNPKIVVTSAAKRSGKTRLLRVLERLLARPLLISGINPTALLRVIEIYGPSILLDEYDALVRSGKEMAEAMRGLLNSGFDKAAARDIKLVPTEDGWEPRAFSTWCPQVIAGIGDVPETVADRSVRITMIRKLRTENVARLRERDGADLSILARQAARWTEDHLEELEEADRHAEGIERPRSRRVVSPVGDRRCGRWQVADFCARGGDRLIRRRRHRILDPADAARRHQAGVRSHRQGRGGREQAQDRQR
jgi:hypothetical protein